MLDELIARIYPSRVWARVDEEATFRRGLGEGEVRRLGQALSAALQAPVYYQEGADDDLCSFLYILCVGREPPLLHVREAGLDLLRDLPAEGGWQVRERYLRVSCSALGRLCAVQEVAMELLAPEPGAPGAGLALLRELPKPGVFDPKLLKRFQRCVDLIMAHDIEHLDMGLLDVPAAQFGLTPGDYAERFGTGPHLFNYLFQAQPVLTVSASYLPLLD